MSRILFLGLAVSMAFAGSAASQDYSKDRAPVHATIAGGAAQGTFASAGEAINEMVRREYPNSSITYEPGSTAGSLSRMMSGLVPLSTGHSPIDIKAALAGSDPFKQKLPRENLKVIARITEGMHPYIFARPEFVEKHQIKTIADLFSKPIPMRINMNQKGTLSVYHQAQALLEYYKSSEEEIKKNGGEPTFLPTPSGIEALKDGKIDVVIWVAFTPDRNARQMIEQEGMVMLPITQGAVDFLATKFGLQKGAIPAGTYKNQDRDLPVTSLPVFLSAGPKADDRTVFAVTSSIVKHFDYFRSIHPLFNNYHVSMLRDVGELPLHPVADAVYRGSGIMP